MRMLFCLLNILNVFSFNSNFTQEKVLEKEISVEKILAVNEISYVSVIENDSYLYYDDLEYEIENRTICNVLDTINNIYLVCNEEEFVEIFIFNKFNKTIVSKTIYNMYLENIYEINNSLYLIGSTLGDGLIYHTNYDLEIIDQRVFNSDDHITVNHLIFYDDSFYISIYKNGITNNSEFINHGNYGDIKSLIVKLDLDYQIINTYYINESSENEIVKNFYLFDNQIKVLLKTKNCYAVYNISLCLTKSSYYNLDISSDIDLIPHYKSIKEDLFIDKSLKKLFIFSNDQVVDIYQITDLEDLYCYKLIDHKLYLYGKNNHTVIYKLKEYEIIKQDSKILNYYNLNYLDTSNIVVESWFGKTMVSIKEITPYFDKTINGEYEISYVVSINKETIKEIKVPLIVQDYTNFYHNGVYKTNKVLEFFGIGSLNGKPMYFGTSLDEAGEYDIEITNINGVKNIYHLYVVDNYYKDEKVINIPAINVYENKGVIEIDLKKQVLKDVIVNNESYDNYSLSSDILTIYFNKNEKNTESFMLNGLILLSDNQENYYEINNQFVFCYLKKSPLIDIYKTLKKDRIEINTNIIDFDKTFVCLKALYNNQEKLISTSDLVNLNDIKNLRLYFSYDLGDGKILDELICEINQDEMFNVNLGIRYESGSIKECNVSVEIIEEDLSKLIIGNVSLVDFYKNDTSTNYLVTIIIICVCLVIVVSGLFIGYVIVKKRKLKGF